MNNKRNAEALKNITLVDWHEDPGSNVQEKTFIAKFQIPADTNCSRSLYLRGFVRSIMNVKSDTVIVPAEAVMWALSGDRVRITPELDDSTAARERHDSFVVGKVLRKSGETISVSVSNISKLVENGPGLEGSSPTDSKRSR